MTRTTSDQESAPVMVGTDGASQPRVDGPPTRPRRTPAQRRRAPGRGRPGNPGNQGTDQGTGETQTETLDSQDDAHDTPDTRSETSHDGVERVILAVGSTYFHNGRVSPERYASDLAPSFMGAIAASHTLLRELFNEMGAKERAPIQAQCDRWRLRYGAEVGQAQFSIDELPTDGGGRGGGPKAGDGSDADSWVRGLVASRDADHGQALAAFEAEATEAVEAGAPQRAAIAYRAAAAAALAAGRGDHANRLQRLGGKAYMEIAEKPDTLPQGVFMAYRESARCFLEAGNLPLAHKCLSKAIAIGETLGYTESS